MRPTIPDSALLAESVARQRESRTQGLLQIASTPRFGVRIRRQTSKEWLSMLRTVLGLVLLAASVNATAATTTCPTIGPLQIEPSHPVAGENITISVRHGPCETIDTRLAPQIVVDGQRIVVTFQALSTGGVGCMHTAMNHRSSLGSFSAGDYELHLYGAGLGLPSFPPRLLSLTPFQVAPAPPELIPAMTAAGTLTLIFLILLLSVPVAFLAARNRAGFFHAREPGSR